MNWPDIAGLGVVGSSLLLLLLYATRKLLGAVDVCVSAHQERLAEREQRASLIAVAEALPDGGLAVQYDQGQLDWVLLKPPPTSITGTIPELLERRVA
ncbi:hypothetical protein ADK90_28020 [Streptomyces sp. XY413]|uniref:hypothetical protein n=1 Tax=unclassified Streptomyces TaxID=2593676 RepID=UPI0006AF04C4|nr:MULTISPECIES: hypothetical protein [unclassified Streptomyces]KOU65104.1 hypothetical protein ADK96_18915 [Streptomyces sp. IGB124]KOV16371.1 hypothetical protein ADK90_28020 [Streptomyces sp. XY413]